MADSAAAAAAEAGWQEPEAKTVSTTWCSGNRAAGIGAQCVQQQQQQQQQLTRQHEEATLSPSVDSDTLVSETLVLASQTEGAVQLQSGVADAGLAQNRAAQQQLLGWLRAQAALVVAEAFEGSTDAPNSGCCPAAGAFAAFKRFYPTLSLAGSLVKHVRSLHPFSTTIRLKYSTMSPVVLAKVDDGIAELVLNRPKALNSLNTEMVTQAYQHYSRWSASGSGVRAILLSGAGGKAFCAGGDVKSVALDVAAGNHEAAMAFFKAEYLTDAAISQLEVPHISLLDGITMGGGAGISMHGHFRVATEKTLFAMPETAIGLFPDVGMMAVLPHLPGQLGAYLALTGARLTGHQVKEAGLATHYIPSSYLPRIKQQLYSAGLAAADLSAVNAILCDIEQTAVKDIGAPKEPSLQRLLPVINRCFALHTVDGVVKALQTEKAERPWCDDALQQLQRGSPLSSAITLSYFQRSRAAGWGPLEALQQDCVLCGHFMSPESDFYEGVRARLIDKDDKPRWKHSSVEEVPDDYVAGFFRPRSEHDVIDLKALLQQQSPQLSRL